MRDKFYLEGMVISSMPIGENDKRIELLTPDRGKISAFCKGARKGKNTLSALTSPFIFATFRAFLGKNSYTIISGEIIKHFDYLEKDYDKLIFASYFLEMASFFSRENIDETERLNLIYMALLYLSKKGYNKSLIRRIYELRTMVINGEYPNIFSCLVCGKKDRLYFYSEEKRGVICDNCKSMVGDIIEMDKNLLKLLSFIIKSPIHKLFNIKVSDTLFERFDKFMARYLYKNMEHKFKSEEFLN